MNESIFKKIWNYSITVGQMINKRTKGRTSKRA